MVIVARNIAGTGVIRANGGDGGNGAPVNGGGGGGGGGGVIWIITETANYASFQTVTVNGGAFGLKSGTGVDGLPGTAGRIFSYILT